MISLSKLIAIIVTLCITLILPVIVAVVYSIKNKGKKVWQAWLLGAAGFFVLQMLIRVPILSVVSTFPAFTKLITEHYVIYCLILAITAAMFEVIARFGVAKILQKNLCYEKALAAGLGHGGIESMLLIGMTYVNNLLYAFMIQTGSFDVMLAQVQATGAVTEEQLGQLAAVKIALVETATGAFYLAGYERILTMICHAAMSLFVCYMVYKKKAVLGVGIAFLIHFCIDFVSPLMNGMATEYLGNQITQNTAYVLIYSFLTLVSVGCVVMMIKISNKWKVENEFH